MIVTDFTEKSVQKIMFGAADWAALDFQLSVTNRPGPRSRCVLIFTSHHTSVLSVWIENKHTRSFV